MPRLSWLAPAALSVLAVSSPAAAAETLNCDIGPVTTIFGHSEWLVYSCDDERSVAIMSAPGSPALPFYFMFTPDEDGEYRLIGEGTGTRAVTDLAYQELSQFGAPEIANLIAETAAN